jgi:hypothetical protein
MPSVFEYHFDGKLSGWSDLGEDECPLCGLPLVGHFQDGTLVETESCSFCRTYDDNERG